MDGADVSLDPWGGAEDLFTVLPQALEHHLHRVLKETFTRKQKPFRWHHKHDRVACRNIVDVSHFLNNRKGWQASQKKIEDVKLFSWAPLSMSWILRATCCCILLWLPQQEGLRGGDWVPFYKELLLVRKLLGQQAFKNRSPAWDNNRCIERERIKTKEGERKKNGWGEWNYSKRIIFQAIFQSPSAVCACCEL